MIQCLTDRNAVEPSFERAAPPKTSNPAERTQKNLLGDVCSISSVREYSIGQVVNASVIIRNKPIKRRVRARLKLRHQRGFIASPRQTLCQLGHMPWSRSSGHLPVRFRHRSALACCYDIRKTVQDVPGRRRTSELADTLK